VDVKEFVDEKKQQSIKRKTKSKKPDSFFKAAPEGLSTGLATRRRKYSGLLPASQGALSQRDEKN